MINLEKYPVIMLNSHKNTSTEINLHAPTGISYWSSSGIAFGILDAVSTYWIKLAMHLVGTTIMARQHVHTDCS